MTQVFISYSRKDLSFVEQLARDLKKSGLDVWYDISGLAGGSRWRREIENAIKNSQYIVVVLSPDSVESEWVEREFLFASNRQRPIIPVLYRSCELPLNYLDLNYVDARGDKYSENFEELLQALNIKAAAGIKASSKARTPAFSLKTGVVVALISIFLVSVIVIALAVFQPSVPAKEPEVPTNVPISVSSKTPVAVDTLAPSLAPTEAVTPTLTPLPAELTDDMGVQMILVPAGEFSMGSGNGDPDEQPVHIVYLGAFYMDKYEATNSLYEDCVDEGYCEEPHQTNSYTHTSYYGNPEFYNYPVVYVDWFQAAAFCDWRDARLPTEAQWEKAARGADGRTFPWGEGLNCDRASYSGCSKDITGIGRHENGISPFGIHEMAGNVWEWVADWYSESYYQNSPASNPLGPEEGVHRVMRGGTWDSPSENLRTFNRLKYKPAFFTEGIGFRCAAQQVLNH